MVFNRSEEEFWSNLEVPIHSYIASEKKLKLVTRLNNKLMADEALWLKELNGMLSLNLMTLKEALSKLYINHKKDFFNLFASYLFFESVDYPKIIVEQVQKNINPPKPISNLGIATFLLFKQNPRILEDIYYLNEIEDSNTKSFDAQVDFNLPSAAATNAKEISAALKRFERKIKNPIKRRKSRAWWTKDTEICLIIAFRRSKRGLSRIPLVTYNKYLKTADLKVLVFWKNSRLLTVISSRELRKTLNIAEFLAQELTGQSVTYTEPRFIYPTAQLLEFFSATAKNEDSKLLVTEAKIGNVALAGSPTVTISVPDGIFKSLKDMSERHSFHLVSGGTTIAFLKVHFKNTPYTLKMKKVGANQSELLITGKEKNSLIKEIVDRLGKINATPPT